MPKGGGEPVFLEMNANGQWLWVQHRTGQPIGLAIASQLLQHSKLGQNYGVFFTNYNGKILWERGRRTEIADITGARLRRQEFTVEVGPTREMYKGDESAQE